MKLLWLVTLIWAFSFSLIGVYLAGQVDTWFSAFSRTAIAAAVFLPFIKWKQLNKQLIWKLIAIGAVQIGLMYSFYYHSFLYLSVAEVLLFTVMTPIYITLINDLLNSTFNRTFFVSALLATLGAIAIRYTELTSDYWFGFLLVQGANLCFAIGQVSYKRISKQQSVSHFNSFGLFFLGATAVLLTGYLLFGDASGLPTTQLQWGIIIYLGLVASGLGYFTWNYAITKVNVGQVASMNNALIPMGILVNLLIWDKSSDLIQLAIGSIIIALSILFSNRKGNENT